MINTITVATPDGLRTGRLTAANHLSTYHRVTADVLTMDDRPYNRGYRQGWLRCLWELGYIDGDTWQTEWEKAWDNWQALAKKENNQKQRSVVC